jgi:8-oxo-dGTP diphosphatase
VIEPQEGCAGVQVIILNHREEVLLQLRDNNSDIPYPGRWCLPGGHLEEDEEPAAAAVRELREEMSLDLSPAVLHHVVTAHRHYGIEHTFWTALDFDAERVPLTEGQAVRFHSIQQIRSTALGYEDNRVLEDFFAVRDHR